MFLGPGIQCFLIFKVDLKSKRESLAYENERLEITEIITISCILQIKLKSPYVCLSRMLALFLTVKCHVKICVLPKVALKFKEALYTWALSV